MDGGPKRPAAAMDGGGGAGGDRGGARQKRMGAQRPRSRAPPASEASDRAAPGMRARASGAA